MKHQEHISVPNEGVCSKTQSSTPQNITWFSNITGIAILKSSYFDSDIDNNTISNVADTDLDNERLRMFCTPNN